MVPSNSETMRNRATLVLLQCVGIVGGHDAAGAQIGGVYFDVPEAKALPFPLALGETFDPTDEDVGAKAAAVESTGLDGAIGGDEEGQYIEAVGGRERNQLDRFAGGLFYEYTSGGSVPWETVDGRHTRGWLDSALQSQQSMDGCAR